MEFISHRAEIVSYCRVICENELILFNDIQLNHFYDANLFWLESHYPFKESYSTIVQLTAMLRYQMPQFFGVRTF